MRLQRVHHQNELRPGDEITLSRRSHRHLATVLRIRPGQLVQLFNGDGFDYTARITGTDRSGITAIVEQQQPARPPSPLTIHCGIALIRPDPFDLCIQKLNELGVAQITPLLTRRSEYRIAAERTDKRLRHWQEIALGSCEQCGRNQPLQIAPPQPFETWLANINATQSTAQDTTHNPVHRRILTPPHQHSEPTAEAALAAPPASVAIASGPEGGFDETELAAAEAAGFQSWCLGPRILRAETAPLVAATLLQARWGDLNDESATPTSAR